MGDQGVRGDLIRWAREQQGLSLSMVRARGGPSISYQSEVEAGKKTDPNPEVLQKWADILQVHVPFLKGTIPRYHAAPDQARGIASDVVPLVERDKERLQSMSVSGRLCEVLRCISRHSVRLPRVPLAYLLGISLSALDDMLIGNLPVPLAQVLALSAITGIPKRFLLEGDGAVSGEPLEKYLPAIDLARSAGLSGADVLEAVKKVVDDSRTPAP